MNKPRSSPPVTPTPDPKWWEFEETKTDAELDAEFNAEFRKPWWFLGSVFVCFFMPIIGAVLVLLTFCCWLLTSKKDKKKKKDINPGKSFAVWGPDWQKKNAKP